MVATASKLSGALEGRGGKGKESLQLRLWNLNSTSNSPVAPRRLSCQIFANQREAETNAIVNKHGKTRAKGNGVITNVISANQPFASIYSFSRDVAASSPSFSPAAARAPQRACSQASFASRTRELPWRLKKWLCCGVFAIWMVIVLMSMLMSSSRDEFTLK